MGLFGLALAVAAANLLAARSRTRRIAALRAAAAPTAAPPAPVAA
ncbi:hypothetical protein AB0873_19630 [Micromonospora sp. NPDC047707]